MSAVESQAYFFGVTNAEQQRLVAQAESFEAPARWLLDQIQIRPGWRTIDVGCGPRGILHLLSERVGSKGIVVGLERELRFAHMAQEQIARRHLGNVTVLQADVMASGLQSSSFDFAHERLVMVNMSSPETLLAELVDLIRPRGIVAVEEIDNASWLCQPPHPSWDKLLQTFHAAFRASGGNVYIGRRLPELLRAAGLEDVQYKVHVDFAMRGGKRRTHLLTLIDSLREQITRLDLLTEEELAGHQQALAGHLDDLNTVVIDKLLVQAWGRKPSWPRTPAPAARSMWPCPLSPTSGAKADIS
jgi:ubiquinone/menaquinone biosynthesis C-methylase UbiE